jgi:hypothetical protein
LDGAELKYEVLVLKRKEAFSFAKRLKRPAPAKSGGGGRCGLPYSMLLPFRAGVRQDVSGSSDGL